MATSIVDHAGPSDPEMQRSFERGPIGLVASYVLAGGTLTGKYRRGERGRAVDDESGSIQRGKRLADQVEALATAWDVPAAHVAFAYAFADPHLASIVFGASSPDQLRQNVAAWDTYTRLDEQQRAAVVRLGDA